MLLLTLLALAATSASQNASLTLKQKVVVVNEDNDHYFKLDPKLMTEEALKAYIDGMAGGKVTHFFMCPSGQRPSYDSKVWEPIWTGLEEPGGFNRGEQTRWAQNAKLLRDRGIDPYQVWIERCRERGISPWLTPRMNDAHNSDQKNPFRSTLFWRNRDDLHCEPGYRGRDWTKCTLDFSHDEVQDYTFALIKEQLDRYDIDGYELDFFRFSEYFPAGKAERSSHYLDRFVKRVRTYVDLKAKERQHPILLGVRVATTPNAARAKGCDVGKWVKEGWVDWVTGSTFWETPDYNMPVAEWRNWFGDKADKVMLLAGTDHGVNATPYGGFRVDMEMGFYAGYADVQWGNGVDGVYLFNVPYLPKALSGISRRGLFPEDLPSQVRRYPVSFRSEAWGGAPDDIQLPKHTDCDNELHVRLGASPTGTVSVLVGVKEPGEFAPMVTLNGVRPKASSPETLHNDHTDGPVVSVDYYCRRYTFPSSAVHAGADNVVKITKIAERKTIIWCEIDLCPESAVGGWCYRVGECEAWQLKLAAEESEDTLCKVDFPGVFDQPTVELKCFWSETPVEGYDFIPGEKDTPPYRCAHPTKDVALALKDGLYDVGREEAGFVLCGAKERPKLFVGESDAEARDIDWNDFEQVMLMDKVATGCWRSKYPLAFRYSRFDGGEKISAQEGGGYDAMHVKAKERQSTL